MRPSIKVCKACSLHRLYSNSLLAKPIPTVSIVFTNITDRCFGEKITTKEMYENSCKEIVMSALNGINGTIFMYGQTGAGKTFSMLGEQTEFVKNTRVSTKVQRQSTWGKSSPIKHNLNRRISGFVSASQNLS